MIAYSVEISFDDKALADSFVRWLVDDHVAAVIAAGALDAEIVTLDGPSPRCVTTYRFESREAFARYERDHAPRLRADGLARIPVGANVRFERTLGEIVRRRA